MPVPDFLPSKSAEPSGPRSRIAPSTRSASSGSVETSGPHQGWISVCMLRLKSGQSSIGTRHASCAQYSKRRPAPSRPETVPRGKAPTLDPSAMRCDRSTVEIESSWTHESRRTVAVTSSAVARRNRVA